MLSSLCVEDRANDKGGLSNATDGAGCRYFAVVLYFTEREPSLQNWQRTVRRLHFRLATQENTLPWLCGRNFRCAGRAGPDLPSQKRRRSSNDRRSCEVPQRSSRRPALHCLG